MLSRIEHGVNTPRKRVFTDFERGGAFSADAVWLMKKGSLGGVFTPCLILNNICEQ